MDYPEPPEPFLELKIHNLDSTPPISALCAGYECGEWRSSQLAEHAMEWLPEFCLTANELKSITSSNALKMIRKAAQSVYQTDKYKNRGEFGELFLHIILRQIYGSIPAISKIYFKDAVNNTVKGFDAVHIINIKDTKDTFELWLGEVKFYNNARQAIYDVIGEIQEHTKQDYLKNEKMLLLNKIDIDPKSPFYPILSKLLAPNTSLKKHTKTTKEFNLELEHEVMKVFDDFKNKISNLTIPIKLHVFLLPLQEKSVLIKKLDEELKRLQ